MQQSYHIIKVLRWSRVTERLAECSLVIVKVLPKVQWLNETRIPAKDLFLQTIQNQQRLVNRLHCILLYSNERVRPLPDSWEWECIDKDDP